ncbi:MSC_0624 family F1-like ATPase-associated membrane protein [Mycoplasmopsis synoviae]|uniref:MSC_0624 family F1-like ATPase-associated membrane protein n=1 Tax=Mycoplasmopsis synoviae TaxID=2109 RepID=UPI00387B6F0B
MEEIVRSSRLNNSKVLRFNWEKENILRVIALSTLFIFVVIFGFLFEFAMKHLSVNLLSYEDLFNTSYTLHKGSNFYVFYTVILFGLLIIISTMKSYFLVNKNNLKFSKYITWYVLYNFYALALLVLFAFSLNVNSNTQANTLLRNSFVIIPLLIIDLSYDFFSLSMQKKYFTLDLKKIILEISYLLIKIVLIVIGFYVLQVFLADKQITAIFINNSFINHLQRIFVVTPIYKNLIIFALIFVFALMIAHKFFANKNKIFNSVIRNKILKHLVQNFLMLFLASIIFAFYALFKTKTKELIFKIENNNELIIFVLVISLIILSSLSFIFLTIFLQKWFNNFDQKKYFILNLLINSFLLLIANLLLNFQNRLIINITCLTLVFMNYLTLLLKNKYKLNSFENLLLSFYLIAGSAILIFSNLLYLTTNENNYYLLVWTHIFDIATVFVLASLVISLLMVISPIIYAILTKIINNIINKENIKKGKEHVQKASKKSN